MQKAENIPNPAELENGMVFETKENLLNVVNDVHIVNHLDMKVVRSNSDSLEVECKRKATGCVWILRARKRTSHNYFEIMETKGPHSGLNPNMTQDHFNFELFKHYKSHCYPNCIRGYYCEPLWIQTFKKKNQACKGETRKKSVQVF